MNKKLSICIPTFNRHPQLLKMLDRCTAEIDNSCLSEAVEILIGDNASIDETNILCNSLIVKYNYIRYYRNTENIGAEANWANLVNQAIGEYVWILSDDDYFIPGLLDDILNITKKETYNQIFLNYSFFSLKDNERNYHDYKNPFVCDKSGFGFLTFFLETKFSSSLVSSNIFNRHAFFEVLPSIQNFKTNPWLLLYTAKNILNERGAWYILSTPKLSMQSVDMMASRRYAFCWASHFHFNAHIEFVIFQKSLNNIYGKKVFKSAISELHLQIMYAKVSWYKLTNKEDFIYWIKALKRLIYSGQYNTNPIFWFREIPLILLPSIFARTIYYYHSVFRPMVLSWVNNRSSGSNLIQKCANILYVKYKNMRHN